VKARRGYAGPGMKGYRVTARKGPKVERERFDDVGQALAAMDRHAQELERTAAALRRVLAP
jgi:hypothetical protein